MNVLLLTDKLGITTGYQEIWNSLLLGAGLQPSRVYPYSIWKTPFASQHMLLTRKGNRKSPGYNPDLDIQSHLLQWVRSTVTASQAGFILCSDTALLGLVESAWDIATIDNLRGGVYDFFGIPFEVITPISAVNQQKKPKDIRTMNDGAESEEEFEEREDRDPEEFFLEPYTIPFGKRVLATDLKKCYRIIQSMS